jgi:small conductance mechanosensitive channel
MATSPNCESNNLFTSLCDAIDPHDQSHLIGPVAQRGLSGLLGFVLVVVGGRLFRSFLQRALHRTGADPQVRILAHNVVTVATWMLALVTALVVGGLNFGVLLTFGGVSTLAIGLAFQDLLRNVLAGIFILIEQPFKIGDLITVSEQSGTVETINLRTTALRTGDGRLAILPNLAAFNGVVVNSSAFDKRQYSVSLYADADGDLELMMRTLRTEVEATEALATDPPPALQPQVDAEGRRLVVIRYWLDYRTHNPDEVAADLVTRVWNATKSEPAAS